jgi:zinc protease
MGRQRVFWLVLAIIIGATPALAQVQDLRVPDLDVLALPANLTARVSRVLPSKPGDTFLQLTNGMTVLVRENHASRVVSCQILVKAGSINEGNHFFGGLSHYLEHVVAGGSTRSFTEMEAREALNSLGGASNAYTSYDSTVYYINTTSAHYRKALKLLLSYVSESLLDPKEVSREKAVIQQEFKLGETDAGRQLWQLFSQTAYLKHPVRHPVLGYEEVFVNVSREDLLDYYHQRYVAQNMVVTVVGDVDTAEAVRAILELSKDMVRGFNPPTVIEEEPAQNSSRWAEKTFPPARLTTMMVGFHTISLTHPDLYPLDLLAIIIGKGRTSRLYSELKDRRELVLSVDSFSWTPSYAPGLFGFSFSLDRDKVDPTLAALWQAVEQVKSSPVEPGELEKAKRQITADFVFSKQSMAEMASSLASSLAATGDPYFDSSYVERIKAVSPEDIQRVARDYLKREASTVAVLSPPQKSSDARVNTATGSVGEITKVRLGNGLTVLLKRNATVPIVDFQVFGLGGQLFEPADQSGISNFTMALLTKGTKQRSKRQIAETVEQLGGHLSSGSGKNTYYVSLSLLKEDYETGLGLLADLLMNPSFPQTEIDKQRQDTLLSIRRLDEDWQSEVERLFRRHYYGAHPYGRDLIGTEASVKEMNRSGIQTFYEGMVMPNNAVMAVFGDIDPGELVSKVESIFGTWHRGKPFRPKEQKVAARLAADTSVQKKTDKVSAAIFVGTNGMTVKDADRAVLDVIDAVLSGIGYPSGWLQEALRGGDRSLVYVVHGFPSYGLDGGYFGVVAQTTMSNYRKVVEIILDKLEKIQREPIAPGELEAAKNMCITMHEMGLESNGAQASSAAVNEVLGLGFDWDSSYPESIGGVSAEDVRRVARKLFRHHMLVSTIPEHPVETVIQPEAREHLHEN